MLTYENLLNEALNRLPSFNKEYQKLMSQNEIDKESGNHIVFGYVFAPLLEKYIKDNEKENIKLFLDFLEEMASSEDYDVNEVCDYSILEQVHDSIPDTTLYPLLGEKTKEGFLAIRQYTRANSLPLTIEELESGKVTL